MNADRYKKSVVCPNQRANYAFAVPPLFTLASLFVPVTGLPCKASCAKKQRFTLPTWQTTPLPPACEILTVVRSLKCKLFKSLLPSATEVAAFYDILAFESRLGKQIEANCRLGLRKASIFADLNAAEA